MLKEIKTSKGDFLIEFFQFDEEFDFFTKDDRKDYIKVLFYPNSIMSEFECKNYTNRYISDLENEIKKIIFKNRKFYSNFDINFSGNFTGFSFVKNLINPKKIIVSDSTMYVNLSLNDNFKILS